MDKSEIKARILDSLQQYHKDLRPHTIGQIAPAVFGYDEYSRHPEKQNTYNVETVKMLLELEADGQVENTGFESEDITKLVKLSRWKPKK